MIRLSRDVTDDEIRFVETLIADDEDAADLRAQVPHLRVAAEFGNDDPTIIFVFVKNWTSRRTIDGVAKDNGDQQPVEVSLLVVDGLIEELEFFRYDGVDVHGLPNPNTLVVGTASDGADPPSPDSGGG